MRNLSIVRHERERQFVEAFFDHDEWEYEPGPFRLSDGSKYTPDFYDKKRNIYIEVVGSRQAFHFNKKKYESFAIECPDKILEFRTKSGKKIVPEKGILFFSKKSDGHLSDIFSQLKKRFGGHGNVAMELGITPRHYFNVRSGKKASEALVKLIKLFAETSKGR